MHKILSSIAVCTILSVTTAYGMCDFGKETVNDIACLGPTKMSDTTVNGSVSVAGPLAMNNSKMDSIEVAGLANLKGSAVSGNTTISGPLQAVHSNFDGNLMITSDKAVLSASSVFGSITMESKEKIPVVELRCKTQVTGSIVFNDKPGIVKKSADSIIKGKVENGKITLLAPGEKCS